MIMDQLFNSSMKLIANKISQDGTGNELAESVLFSNWVLIEIICLQEQLINAEFLLDIVISKIRNSKFNLLRFVEQIFGYLFEEDMLKVVRCFVRKVDVFILYCVNWNKIKYKEIVKSITWNLVLEQGGLPRHYLLPSCDCLYSNYLSVPICLNSEWLEALSDFIFLPHPKKHGHHHSI